LKIPNGRIIEKREGHMANVFYVWDNHEHWSNFKFPLPYNVYFEN